MKKKKRQREKKTQKRKTSDAGCTQQGRALIGHTFSIFSAVQVSHNNKKTTTSINTHHSDTESSVTTNKNHQNRLEFSPGCVRKLRAAFQFSPSPRFFTKEGKEKVGAKHAKKARIVIQRSR